MRRGACVVLGACLGCSGADDAQVVIDDTEAPQCPELEVAVVSGALEPIALDEASGLVASGTFDEVVWAHNDGDEGALFALNFAGRLLDIVALDDTDALDIEDIARAPSQTRSALWLADIGDNDAVRASVQLLGVPEPQQLGDATAVSARIRVTYPTGPADAEAFFIDPRTRDGYIITKAEDDGAVATVFRIPGPLVAGEIMAEAIGTLDVIGPITGADMRNDAIVARSSGRAVWWSVERDQSVADALGQPPCNVPLGSEEQGEAIAFVADGYLTTSEGRGAPVHRVTELD